MQQFPNLDIPVRHFGILVKPGKQERPEHVYDQYRCDVSGAFAIRYMGRLTHESLSVCAGVSIGQTSDGPVERSNDVEQTVTSATCQGCRVWKKVTQDIQDNQRQIAISFPDHLGRDLDMRAPDRLRHCHENLQHNRAVQESELVISACQLH